MHQPAITTQTDYQRQLSAADLRKRTPLINLEKVRGGDILLTCGNDLISKGIAAATGGDFSHAAIWLPTPEYPHQLILAEAEDLGVGFTPLPIVSVSLDDRHHHLMGSLPGNPKRFKLLRHPGLNERSDEDLRAVSQRLQKRCFNKSYSDYARLTDAAQLKPMLDAVARSLLSMADRRRSPTRQSGPFCSELVALYFQELGLSLFAGHTPPEKINPNTFDGGTCTLNEVEGAFIIASQITEKASGSESWCEALNRESLLPGWVRGAEVGAAVDEFNRTLQQEYATKNEEFRKNSDKVFVNLISSLKDARERGDDRDCAKLERLIATAFFVIHLNRQITQRERQFGRSKNIERQNSLFLLQQQEWRLDLDVSHASNRYHTLRALSSIRARQRKSTISWRESRQLKRARRKFIENWKTCKALRAVKPPAPPASEANATSTEYMTEIVRSAHEAALASWARFWVSLAAETVEPSRLIDT